MERSPYLSWATLSWTGGQGISGALAAASSGQAMGLNGMICPRENAWRQPCGRPLRSSGGAARSGGGRLAVGSQSIYAGCRGAFHRYRAIPSFLAISGQAQARRALEVLRRNHHILMIGPPGAARPCSPAVRHHPSGVDSPSDRATGSTPPRAHQGGGPAGGPAPSAVRHHTIFDAGSWAGAGPRARESVAIGGLFLDELPEFRKNSLSPAPSP